MAQVSSASSSVSLVGSVLKFNIEQFCGGCLRKLRNGYIYAFVISELWGLVNNAGVLGVLGPLEWLRQEDFVNIIEINILGMVRVTRTFLPLLKRSQHGGRIVNTSSILGKLSFPYAAPYCMTKHAVEAFSDALR